MFMAVNVTTDKTYEADTNKGVAVTDFWATWCGPCKMQSPVVEQLADEMGDKVSFTKMDVDENPDTPSKFGIMGIPTLIVKKDGNVVDTLVGYHTKEQIQKKLAQYMA